MAMRETLVAAVCLASVMGSCGKKPSTQSSTSTANVVPQIKDTADVFDEFYSEDSGVSAEAKKIPAPKETFTTAAPTPTPAPASTPAPAPEAEPFMAEFSTSGRYVVQVSTVRSKSLADHTADKLKGKGFPAYVAEVNNPTPDLNGIYYRVRIGGFDAIAAAKSFAETSLTPAGHEYWIDKRSNDNVGMEGYGLGNGSSSAGTYGYTPSPSSGNSAYTPPSTPSSSWEESPAPAVSTQPAAAPIPPAPVAETQPAPAPKPAVQTPPQSPPPSSGTKQGGTWGKDDWGSSEGGW